VDASGSMSWFQVLILIQSYGVLIGVWYGIHVMNSNAKQRADEFEKRHDESMLALRTLIERTGG